jgi:hypothetical protein
MVGSPAQGWMIFCLYTRVGGQIKFPKFNPFYQHQIHINMNQEELKTPMKGEIVGKWLVKS